MKTRIIIIAAAILFLTGILFCLIRPTPNHIYLTIGGTPGTAFNGVYVIDGIQYRISGTLPKQIEVAAKRSFSYQLYKQQDSGQIFAKFKSTGGSSGSSCTSEPNGGVSGSIDIIAWLFPEFCSTRSLRSQNKA